MSSLSVIVVSHDSADHLARLLPSIDVPAQVIVVETGRDPGEATIHLPENPGFGAANNAAIAQAGGDICALLNPDVVLPPGALGALAAAAERTDALHVPRLIYPDGTAQDSIHPLPGARLNYLRALSPGRVRRAIGERAAGWAIAAMMVARTETLRRLGPFDPAIHLFYEDLDLCLRARAAGVPLRLHPHLAVTHVGGHSTGAEDIPLQVSRRRDVAGRDWPADRRALMLEHAVRAFRARDRAWVGALRRG
ncbi:MAG: glycosyltransferase family 2 protein [Solirubrobacteraceae bacterium]